VALANIHILQNEGVIERVDEDTGPYLQARWRELGDHPLVGETRGVGFLAALELVRSKDPVTFFEEPGKAGSLCRELCFANGLVMRAVRDSMIVAPPLVMSRANIDELIDKARLCLDLTARELGMF
jgi:putrescine aminotransferase